MRRLTFGEGFVRHLGYYIGGWSMPGTDGESLNYNVPGKLAALGDSGAFIAFASPPLSFDRHDPAVQKQIIRSRFAGLGPGDHAAAFARYEQRLRAFARRAQRGGDAAGRFLAPRTARGIRLRNWMNNQDWFIRLTLRIADDRGARIDLPGYGLSPASPRPPR
ncbi:hypothetical protein [Actinoplanes sp. N902-109]|uniref:hypothetical protein n=1 Tax=Actinoplanes sp. (strain N902-109) TaxID=649831 RepID=UPI00039E6E1A|nr:hypothetical protein [Actinoplanes sp. N902-109]